ncbi:MAG: hypothetical protein N838_21065 [Thiohalocapsa sp. PB-PSB1]|jgi:hypothetical protein|nr:MAG: hypothetical protein N838_21065 [Thiohalocapsa sp. PB-PSB1]
MKSINQFAGDVVDQRVQEKMLDTGRGFDPRSDASCNHSTNPSLKVAMSQVLS